MAARRFTIALLALTLAGCATNNELRPISPMPEAEYAQLMLAQSEAGTGSISREAFLHGSQRPNTLWQQQQYAAVAGNALHRKAATGRTGWYSIAGSI